MHAPDLRMMVGQGLPRRSGREGGSGSRGGRHGQLAFPRTALLEAMTPSSSFQAATKDFAPSSWSFAARASTLTPAFSNRASTASLSPPSGESVPPMSPWSASALSVASGIVFTVKGAASDLTYRTSDAFGSFVPVDAQSRRWGLAPALYARCQRGEESRPRYAL